MKYIKSLCLALLTILFVITGCKKKFDLPPAPASIANSGDITIDSVIRKYGSYYITSTVTPTKIYRFSNDANITCTVTADETSGNIYKGVFVQDQTGTLQVKLLNSGGLFVGDLIRINLRNIILNDYGKMIQLDSVDIEKSVAKISSGHPVVPTKMTFNQLMSNNSFALKKYQARLVLLDSVSFAAGDKAQTYADTINKFSLDRILENSAGQQITVRTSGYANFAKNKIPCGKGSLVAIVGEYNGSLQLTVRDFSEIKLTNDNCPLIVKSFNDLSVNSGGWTTQNVTGNVNWTVGTFGGRLYGNISNYSGGNIACETWLISPPVDISNAANPIFSFASAYSFNGPTLQVLVSTDYTSGNPTAATWTPLNPTLSSGSFAWTSSGILSLSAYKSGNTRVAFKYTGTSTSGSTWEVDDIAIYAQ